MILLTGATGFLGSYLLEELVRAGYKVRAMRHRKQIPFRISEQAAAKAEWIDGDLLDVVGLEDLLRDCKTVIHAAGMVSFDRQDEKQLYQTNIEGTANLVNAALEYGVPEFVFISSVAALGKSEPGQPVNEKTPWEPGLERSPYAISKYFAEREVWRGMGEGLSTLILNPSTMLGYGDWDTTSNRLFRNAYDSFPWYTEGENGFVDVRDVARATVGLLESERRDERFLVSAENWSYKKLFMQMAKELGKKPPSRLAGPFLSGIAWRLEKIKSSFNGKKPLLTRETAAIARDKTAYDNRKLLEALPGFRYTSLEDSLHEASACYLTLAAGKNPA